MSWLYACWHCAVRYWLVGAVVLIGATFLANYAALGPRNGPEWSDYAYATLKSFALDGPENVKAEDRTVWSEWARWLGAVVWSFAIVTVLVGLFCERIQTWYVRGCMLLYFGRRHVVVAGLGEPHENRDRLVRALRNLGRDVVVLEPNPHHPGIPGCRTAGAICMIGSAEEAEELRRAQLQYASTLLVLGSDGRRNVAVLKSAHRVRQRGESARRAMPAGGQLAHVVQIDDSGVIDVLRSAYEHVGHHLLHDPSLPVHVRLFNTPEIVARVMLREALVGPEIASLRRILVVGTGERGRLAEELVVRASKDRWIDRGDAPFTKLEVIVLDRRADEWSQKVARQHAFISEVCEFDPMPGSVSAAECGFRSGAVRKYLEENPVDVAFVCLEDDSQALVQTNQLRSVLDEGVPIVTCVREERTAIGDLLAWTADRHIRVVGIHDRMFDVLVSMDPSIESMSQVLHQDYLYAFGVDPDASHGSKVRWTNLPERLRQSNRSLARRLRNHLLVPEIDGRPAKRFDLKYAPEELLQPDAAMSLTPEECEVMARREHETWVEEQLVEGMQYGPERSDEKMTNPNLVSWEDLEEHVREFNRNIIRRLPHACAKADFKLVATQTNDG